jgi:hypothetical protein
MLRRICQYYWGLYEDTPKMAVIISFAVVSAVILLFLTEIEDYIPAGFWRQLSVLSSQLVCVTSTIVISLRLDL